MELKLLHELFVNFSEFVHLGVELLLLALFCLLLLLLSHEHPLLLFYAFLLGERHLLNGLPLV